MARHERVKSLRLPYQHDLVSKILDNHDRFLCLPDHPDVKPKTPRVPGTVQGKSGVQVLRTYHHEDGTTQHLLYHQDWESVYEGGIWPDVTLDDVVLDGPKDGDT